ncbi:MAG: DUF1285 domain-containing protein [Pseudomonadota bacterium]
MHELQRYAAELEEQGGDYAPPVESWAPERTGDIDIVIRRDGSWVHEGGLIRRAKLARLFSTILRRDGEDYYLVTPVEKLRIKVEDAPFVAIALTVSGEGSKQRLEFKTNLGDRLVAGPDHPIAETIDNRDSEAPYILVRGRLWARIGRAVYYDLVALAERRHMDGEDVYGVWSDGAFFVLGRGRDVVE